MFFNLASAYSVVSGFFEQIIESISLTPFLAFLREWWWLLSFFLFVKPFLFFWHWWRFEIFLANKWHPVLLEIKIPKDMVKPIRAMENVMSSLHGIIYHPPDQWEEWIEGQFQTSLSFEIASMGGDIHFYVRVHEGYRDSVEAAFYSQYPDIELVEVEDYTKLVPQDIPNKDWSMWGTDYKLLKHNAYPILTYKKFETIPDADEEKKVDPIAALLEGFAKVKEGECFWIQISACPVTDSTSDWRTEGKKLVEVLAKRELAQKEYKPKKPLALEALDLLIEGKIPEKQEKPEKDIFPPELRLTPGEKDIVTAVEEKLSKPAFDTHIRFIFMGKRDVFNKGNFRLGFSFFASFYTANLNALIPFGETISKVKMSWFLPLNLIRARRLYLRNRKMFRNYVDRLSAFYPRGPKNTSFILNIEEMASLFHFPSWEVSPVPGMSRIEATKKAPPSLLK